MGRYRKKPQRESQYLVAALHELGELVTKPYSSAVHLRRQAMRAGEFHEPGSGDTFHAVTDQPSPVPNEKKWDGDGPRVVVEEWREGGYYLIIDRKFDASIARSKSKRAAERIARALNHVQELIAWLDEVAPGVDHALRPMMSVRAYVAGVESRAKSNLVKS